MKKKKEIGSVLICSTSMLLCPRVLSVKLARKTKCDVKVIHSILPPHFSLIPPQNHKKVLLLASFRLLSSSNVENFFFSFFSFLGKYRTMAMGSKTKRAINFSKGNEKKEKKKLERKKKFFLHNKKAPEVEKKVFHSVKLRKKKIIFFHSFRKRKRK